MGFSIRVTLWTIAGGAVATVLLYETSRRLGLTRSTYFGRTAEEIETVVNKIVAPNLVSAVQKDIGEDGFQRRGIFQPDGRLYYYLWRQVGEKAKLRIYPADGGDDILFSTKSDILNRSPGPLIIPKQLNGKGEGK